MNFMITTRCNMRCAHCCFSCTEIGEDMSFDNFKKGVDMFVPILKSAGANIILLGGGEPTLHERLFDMIDYIKFKKIMPEIVTNGQIEDVCLELSSMAKKGKIIAMLSESVWHQDISDNVKNSFYDGMTEYVLGRGSHFMKPKNSFDLRRIRAISVSCKTGRSKENNIGVNICCCKTLIVKPSGDIYPCGCENVPIVGNIYSGIFNEYKKKVPLLKDKYIPRLCYSQWS